MVGSSSRRRFREYLERARRRDGGRRADEGADAPRKTERHRSFGELLVEFWRLLRGHRSTLVFALATLTVATVLRLAPPAATKWAVDSVLVPNGPLPGWLERAVPSTDRLVVLAVLSGGVVGVSILSSLMHLWGRWHATRCVNRVQVVLRRRLFEHAVRLPLHRVYQLKSGGASSLLREDAGSVAELIFSMIYNPWRAIVQFIGSLLVLMWVDWRLMLGGMMLVPVVYFTHRTWIRRIRPLYRDVRSERQEIDGYATEAFGGMRVVRAFARERSEAARFVRGNDLLIRKQLLAWWWTRIIEFVWEVAIPLASGLLLFYGGARILRAELTLGDLMMFLFYLAMLLDPMATLVASATTFQNSLAGLDRILDILAEPREMRPAPGATLVPFDRARIEGGIAFRGVGFRYPESERHVLEGIDLDVRAGETIALVGRSGAGKTTFCNLVARFYDPTEGRVELDGRDLRAIPIESYRGTLGIVEQDVFLFDGTIAQNIGYARRSASAERIEAAARLAHAHEFIGRLDMAYDTVIGERGVKLSGGQRQRIAIARAVLADPKILILDEATSNLDTESERLIQESLRGLLAERTCFVIAHRMSTVRLADRIVVLEQGRVVEIGTHDELMRSADRYRRMVELQVEG
ncbi:MAG: ABC transporter ATP-binding protein [Planctomycetes bacterium]|nr:ABC transporter ATP-binding protein [Planctomycetota bacterium]